MIKYHKILLCVLIVAVSGISILCADSLCENQGTIRESIKKGPVNPETSVLRKFARYQKEGRVRISRTMRKLRKEFSIKIFLWLFLFSLGYGIFHAVGPGHGKAIVAFYLLHCKASVADALKLVGVIVLTHTGLAVLLAFFFHTILGSMKGMAGIALQNNFSFVGGILIILIGSILLVKEFKNSDEAKRSSIAVSNTNIYLMGITAGIVPCPISLTIMLISLSTGVWYIGFTSVLAISLGLALVLFLVAVCVEKSREGILGMITSNMRVSGIISSVFSYGGLIAVILLGVFITIFYFPAGRF